MMVAPGKMAAGSPLTVVEWEVLRPERFADPRAFRELHAWALTDEGRRVLEAGAGKIRVLNHVGVVMTKSGQVLEILPKTERKVDIPASREILLAMLARAGRLPAWEGPTAPAEVASLPLSESLARLFRHELVRLAKRGLIASYQPHEEDLPVIRGRLRFSDFARRGARIDSLPCAYDERSTATRENRVLATALEACEMLSWGSQGPAQRIMLLEAFESVMPFPSAGEALTALRSTAPDRMNRGYREAMKLAELILSGLDVAGTWAAQIRFALFFPMEIVFERFVYAALKDLEREGHLSSVSYQASPFWLLKRRIEGLDRRSFNLRPDLTVTTRDGRRLILDAKWKLLEQEAADGKHGISQADLYQLLSYATIYRSTSQPVDGLALVYPAWEGFDETIECRYADTAGTRLVVIPMPLHGAPATGWCAAIISPSLPLPLKAAISPVQTAASA